MLRSSNARFALVAAFLAAAFSIIIKLPTLKYPLTNWDGIIYLELSRRLLDGEPYSLMGSRLLEHLPRSFYEHPVFHHPPGFSLLLTPFVALKALNAAVVLSWLGHVLVLASIALLGYHLLLRETPADFRLRCAFLLPLAAAAADPLMNFIGRRVWIDNLLAGTACLSLSLAFLSRSAARPVLWLAAGGLLAGLACSLKVTAALLLPFLAWLASSSGRRGAARYLAALGPPVIVLASWFLFFRVQTGAWLPYWTRPDQALLEASPFVAASAQQPVAAYLFKTISCMPFLVVLLATAPFFVSSLRRPAERMAALWMAASLAVFALLGAGGFAKETRYMSPLVPAACWLFYGRYREESERLRGWNDRFFSLFLFAALAGAMLSGYYLLMPQFDEMLGPWELLRLIFQNAR